MRDDVRDREGLLFHDGLLVSVLPDSQGTVTQGRGGKMRETCCNATPFRKLICAIMTTGERVSLRKRRPSAVALKERLTGTGSVFDTRLQRLPPF